VQKTVDAISAELRLLPNLEEVTGGMSVLLPNATNRLVGKFVRKDGGPGRDRTDDLFHAMEARSQLRHRPTGIIQFSLSFAVASNSTRRVDAKSPRQLGYCCLYKTTQFGAPC
jgi:hypothetical protein